MTVPSNRMLWVVALIGVPLAIAGALVPAFAWAFWLAGAALVLLAIIDSQLSPDLAHLDIELPDLVRTYRDRDTSIEVRIDNRLTSATTLRMAIPFPESFATQGEDRFVLAAAGGWSAVEWKFTPHRRGSFKIDAAHIEGSSRLGLWLVRRKLATACEVRVYPNLRDSDSLAGIRLGAQGQSQMRQIGKGREFEKLREYLPGDDFDEIHWKATARRGKPITKVYQLERTQEIYVILDASRLSARKVGSEVVLERYVNAALVLGAAAERRGDLFGLAAFSDRIEAFVRARTGKSHFAVCRDALYQLHPKIVTPGFDEVATFLRVKLRRRALILFLTELNDPVLAENFAAAVRVLTGQHLVMAGMLRPPGVEQLFSGNSPVESDEQLYGKLGGHLAWRALREFEITMRRKGVRLALFSPETVATQVVGLYQEVKQRQLL
ncbi:MAG TPA: DUF58 domain-containing protein [Bryobacteraceae bacterium]|jgi:uncharacterized protein (DUF58 family)